MIVGVEGKDRLAVIGMCAGNGRNGTSSQNFEINSEEEE
jgi:hypothetical protein